jgi:Uma2 family endonuclease
MVTKARVTAQDLWRLGEGDVRRELVNGEVKEMPPVGGVHGQITVRTCAWLGGYVRGHGGGEAVAGSVPLTWRSFLPRGCRGDACPRASLWAPPT